MGGGGRAGAQPPTPPALAAGGDQLPSLWFPLQGSARRPHARGTRAGGLSPPPGPGRSPSATRGWEAGVGDTHPPPGGVNGGRPL